MHSSSCTLRKHDDRSNFTSSLFICVCVVGWPKMCVFRPVLGASGLVGSSRQRKVTVCPRKQRLQVISFISMPKNSNSKPIEVAHNWATEKKTIAKVNPPRKAPRRSTKTLLQERTIYGAAIRLIKRKLDFGSFCRFGDNNVGALHVLFNGTIWGGAKSKWFDLQSVTLNRPNCKTYK